MNQIWRWIHVYLKWVNIISQYLTIMLYLIITIYYHVMRIDPLAKMEDTPKYHTAIIAIWWFPFLWGYPPSSSIYSSDFPSYTISTPMTSWKQDTPTCYDRIRSSAFHVQISGSMKIFFDICFWDFPRNKPSSELGVSPWRAGNPHIPSYPIISPLYSIISPESHYIPLYFHWWKPLNH